MSLKIKHLNSDASFLLSFEPIPTSFPPTPGQSSTPFTILLDPWVSGPSKIWHSKFSTSKHRIPACISSLTELPEPDLVIISQSKTDHCHRETLTQLPPSGGKTVILAEPAAAKIIRGWKHFDAEKVVTLPKWEEPRGRKTSTVHRVPVPALSPEGSRGEVTIAYMAQKADLTGLHSAVGITYRPPTSQDMFPLTPPASPHSGQSFATTHRPDRALSVIFSPHGCSYKTLSPYVASHLITEAALPLTALLHCFDRITNSWYLGGNICSGFPGGLAIAQNLCAQTWISAHDGDKESTGFAVTNLVVEKYDREKVESIVSPRNEKFPNRRTGTEAVVLQPGEEKHLIQSMMDLDADTSTPRTSQETA
ncbi:hypothetical protein GLAREA_00355 [Glarea lozoyensis ATCC 20868]|uniref:Metallo-hydrolase/oxidoreductase n=1 Tax=Glarea lozoyensis (strain ATCC 20868 / MF5171) TaxID=1116229 RepID=S3CU53_GLAL2|nr:uncharacterized protein GLAREA_00355 [Glarea lozoyensis ATCC 20868]EPE29195.1 hypothetical protein GLAREA_00355 [Glarea lozoyensis ATCC 20868]